MHPTRGLHPTCVGNAGKSAAAGRQSTPTPFGPRTLPRPLQRITEHKAPFLALLLPPWVEARYPGAAAALRANEQRLASHYDLYTTLQHLLHLGESDAPLPQQYPAWREAGNVTAAVRWGVSLLDELPAGRTCDDAGIPAEWCGCFPP